MWYSYKEACEILWVEKADSIFNSTWVSKWRQKLTEEEKKSKEYIKLTEDAHGKIFHKWLEERWIKHTHIWNEAGQSWSKNIIIMMAKKKALWVSKWFPDYIVYIPFREWYATVYIELKKAPWKQWWWNWSLFKEEQAWWLDKLQRVPFTWVWLCQWSEEAINLIDDILKTLEDKDLKETLEIWEQRNIVDFYCKINW